MTIEIIGRASVAPGANSVQELRKVLSEGLCTITRIPDDRWDSARFWHPAQGIPGKTYTFAAGVLDDIYAFDPAVFGLSQREAMQMDPQQRVLLNLVWQALEDANLPVSKLADERVGVYIGASSLESGNLLSEDPAAGSPYFMTGNTLSIVSNRISHVFGLKGPSMTIDTACSSSLVALDQAVAALEKGDIDTAIVGGINLLVHPLSFVGFAQARMLSPEGLCRAYDTNGHGYVRSEGGVAIVLRRSDRARQEQDRSHARLHAVAVNSSGRTNFISLPSREAQAALLRSIYESGAIDVNRLAFIEGHGTGTRVGDPAEVWAIGTVIGKKRRAPVPIGSIKTNIGHTEPASGLFGLLKAMIALEDNSLPASLHIERVNEDIDFDGLNVRVTTSAVKLLPAKEPRFAGINSFGFGGTNAHVVISDPERVAPLDPPKGEGALFVASAHTAAALSRLLEDYRTRLSASAPQEARRIIGSTAANREALRHRFAVEAKDSEGVLKAIETHLAGDASQGERGETPAQAARIAFVFSGNGAQWAGMGVEAYQENRHFRQCFQSFSALFEYHLGEKLTDVLVAPDLALRLGDTKIAQPLLFAVQSSLSDCLVALGVRPDVVFGHSVGEIAAAYVAKALTAAEAVAIVAKRSRYQDLFAGQGKMAAVVMNEEAALAFARANGLDEICVAAINAPNSVTISGPTDEIQAFRDAARKAQIVAHVLDINYPFHHPIIDKAKDAFLADLPQIEPETGACTFVSTVTGAVQDGRGLDAEYWWHNVREPVMFKAAAQAAMDMGCNLFIEISPRPILSNYVSDIAKQNSIPAVVTATLQRETPVPGRDPVAQSFARAVAHGASPLLSRHSGKRNAFVDLPSLPFEPIDLQSLSTTDEIDVFGRNAKLPYTLLGWRADPNGAHWKNHIDARLFPDLAEHVVDSRAILPGSGFIEIAVTAAQRYYGTDEVEISNLEIVRPLELRQDRIVELSTLLSPETGYIEIRSRERLSHDDWTVHAVARSRRPIDAEAEVAMARPAGTQGSVVTSEEAYETAERFGLQYGPRFQLLSKATSFGRTFIEVDLKPAEKPAHPFIEYNLNPFSVDAAFHGLVALFGELSGNEAGAPYIPVRFGSIRVSGRGGPIAKARIEIERFSGYSIKVRFQMFDAAGNRIAVFDDCRFRRTSLRRHHTLASVAFHYESVPASLVSSRDEQRLDAADIFAAVKSRPCDNASLLIDAAIYRACHEIAATVADHRRIVSVRRLPGDAQFRSFLTNCLFVLEDAGIATSDEGEWHIPRDFTLPPVSEILQEVYREDSGRVAEAVLVNNAYCDALERLSSASLHDHSEKGARADNVSEATLDHVLVHSPLAGRRLSAVVEAVEAAFAAGNGEVRHILKAGSTSVALSRRLAAIAAENGATLTIAEPRESVRRTLELAFEHDVHVSLPEMDKLKALPSADLVVAAGTQSQKLLSSHDEIRTAIRSAAVNGAALLFADRAPSAFNDFVFGQSDGWFENSQSPEFPIGQLGTGPQVEDLIGDLGFVRPHVEERGYPEGALLLATASAAVAPREVAAFEPGNPVLLLAERVEPAMSFATAKVDALDADCGQAELGKAFARFEDQPLRLIYVAERKGTRDVSMLAQDRLRRFGLLAEALVAYLRDAGIFAARPKLIIVAPGGSPLAGEATDEANAGLWTFARVLQNEYDLFDVHLVDAETDAPATSAAVTEIFSASTNNHEWTIVDGRLREIRAATGPFPSSDVLVSDFSAATIRQLVSSRVDSIAWEACDLPVPDKDEVVIAVEATGLNFRDVMWAMGLLPEEALEDGFAGATIGMELAGRVVQVGSDVNDLYPGDRVMGIAPAAFSTHVRVRRDGVTKFPDRLNFTAAATVPVAFLTAYYAMVQLGNIEKGETILIHGAAGGVGLAALQIAKLKGTVVIATAGTVEKRRFLEALGADHIFDSRSLDFVARVRGVTNGEGVDLVLNSLFSEAMERSIELVKPFGRFLELGKRDYYSDRKIGLRPFRRNISYFGIDADQLLVSLPAVTKKIFTEIGRLFGEGKLAPLPYRAFSHDEIGSAFRLMQNSGHIGKIVVRPPVAGKDKVLAAPSKPLRFSEDGIFLVAGGIGGFGLSAAEWLVAKGVRRIALCSRRGIADDATLAAIVAWHKKGVHATVHACDITDEAAASLLLGLLRSEGPVRGIIHAAMVLDDALLSNLTPERNKPVVDVKVRGAEILHRLTLKDDLQLFLLFSSATTMIGNPGQANYVIANGYLEGLARARRAAGLPALAVGFGAIADTGFLARNSEVNELLSKRIGKTAMKAREALEQVERYIVADTGSVDAAAVVIAEVDWNAVRMLPISRGAIFETALRHAGSSNATAEGDTIDLEELIRGKSAEEAQQILHTLVAGEIAAILRVTEDSITPDKILKEIGLDSLMAMELGMGFQQKTGFDIPLSGVGDDTTVGDVVTRLRERVSTHSDETEDAAPAENGVVDKLVKSHSVAKQQKAAAH
jgi:acyl transferase domain-containing protein/NADPH:quinone reductase-like Zn-dependent oxidoreductase/acyl carrier protein/short-subunit dehydrogenase